MPIDRKKSHEEKLRELVNEIRNTDYLTEFGEDYKYSDKLYEISKEFRFSDAVLSSDEEIDDRHIIDNLSIKQIRDDDRDKDDDRNKIDI